MCPMAGFVTGDVELSGSATSVSHFFNGCSDFRSDFKI
jgi:hypothetical protein